MPLRRKMQTILLILVVLAALLMIIAIPIISASMLEHIQLKVYEQIDTLKAKGAVSEAHIISHGPKMIAWTFPMWSFLSIFAGITILITAKAFYTGAKWARSLILVCLAIPAVAGAYMFIPWHYFYPPSLSAPLAGSDTEPISPALYITLIGLIPYFTILLQNVVGVKRKTILFVVFALLGAAAAYSFGNGTAANRLLAVHPQLPLYAEGIYVFQIARSGNWAGSIILIASIYFLHSRQLSGWYLARIGAAIVAVSNLVTYYLHPDMFDYFANGALALVLLIILTFNVIKKEFIDS